MKISDFLQAEPAKLGVANRAGHVIAGSVVHLNYQRTALRAGLYLVRLTARSDRVVSHSDLASSLKVGRIASLIGMPLLSAVVTERGVTSGPLAHKLGATRTALRDHRVPAIGGGAPATIGIDREGSSQHKLLPLVDDDLLIAAQYRLHIVGMKSLLALRASHVHSAFCDLDGQILTQAIHTGEMMASAEARKILNRLLNEAERTLDVGAVEAGSGGGEGGCGTMLHLGRC